MICIECDDYRTADSDTKGPDAVDTSMGKLEFHEGVPTDATVATAYDNLDRMRVLEVFLDIITSRLRVYPLKDAEKLAATEFVNMSNKFFNANFRCDIRYFRSLVNVIHEGRLAASNLEVCGAIAAVGNVNGRPLDPAERKKNS